MAIFQLLHFHEYEIAIHNCIIITKLCFVNDEQTRSRYNANPQQKDQGTLLYQGNINTSMC